MCLPFNAIIESKDTIFPTPFTHHVRISRARAKFEPSLAAVMVWAGPLEKVDGWSRFPQDHGEVAGISSTRQMTRPPRPSRG